MSKLGSGFNSGYHETLKTILHGKVFNLFFSTTGNASKAKISAIIV